MNSNILSESDIVMNPSIFENAMKKSQYIDLEKRKNALGYWIGLVFRAKIGHYKSEILPKLDERLPHLHFRHQSALVSTYESLSSYDIHSKENELKILVKHLNGLLIKPNAIFSFWKNIGSFRSASINTTTHLASQKIKGTAPAVCQVTNMLYWLALHSSLDIIERHRHNYDLYPDHRRSRPFGTGATCIQNLYDLKFQNKTDSIFQIVLTYNDGVLYGELRSLTLQTHQYEIFEERHLIKKNKFGDYMRHNTIYRKNKNMKTQKIKIEYITENHALMVYEPLETIEAIHTSDLKMGDIAL